MNESIRKLAQILKDTDSENKSSFQLAAENTQTELAIENIQLGRVIYDTSSEKTLENVKNGKSFFNTIENPEHGWMWNRKTFQELGRTNIETSNKKNDRTPSFQKNISLFHHMIL